MRLILVFLVGCSAAEPKVCAQRKGTYAIRYAERQGNCGPINEVVDTLDRQPVAPPSGCKGSIVYSNNNCTVTSDATCPTTDGQTIRLNGKTEWDELGDEGTGVQQATLTKGGTVVCRSTYDTSVRRF